MYVRMYVSMYVFMYVCMCLYVFMHVCISVCMRVYACCPDACEACQFLVEYFGCFFVYPPRLACSCVCCLWNVSIASGMLIARGMFRLFFRLPSPLSLCLCPDASRMCLMLLERVHRHTPIHAYINTYMHACMHTYIHTYMHT